MTPLIFIRSAIFMLWFAVVTVVIYIGVLPALLLPRRLIVQASRLWSRAVIFGLRVFAGLSYEVRGQPPRSPVLIASKHMSMWDTMALYLVVDDPAAVLKRELLRIPFYGWYLAKAGVIPIDRGGHASALRRMIVKAKAALAAGRPILIFPEGTRKKPSAPADYKSGVAGLYGHLDIPCVPVALNSGLFWTGFVKKPGAIVLEFLKPIPAGLKRAEFMRQLEITIETATAQLVSEGEKSLATASNSLPA